MTTPRQFERWSFAENQTKISAMENTFLVWQCHLCGFVYDEALGLLSEGFAPGTRWSDIPENWSCPDCGYAKSDFQMIEI